MDQSHHTSTSASASASASASEFESSSSHIMMMMKAYFHFTPGDVFLFKNIVPSSPGTILAACLITFLLAILGRFVASVARGIHHRSAVKPASLLHQCHSEESQSNLVLPTTKFVLSYELKRSVIVGLEVCLHYTLMLIVMTFNVAYIISLILGAMVGELAFGRRHRIVH